MSHLVCPMSFNSCCCLLVLNSRKPESSELLEFVFAGTRPCGGNSVFLANSSHLTNVMSLDVKSYKGNVYLGGQMRHLRLSILGCSGARAR